MQRDAPVTLPLFDEGRRTPGQTSPFDPILPYVQRCPPEGMDKGMARSFPWWPGRRSLTLRLAALWALSLAASLVVGLLLLQLSRQTSEAQAARAEAVVARACGLIGERYAFYASGWRGPAAVPSDPAFRDGLTAAVSLALARQDGVEGGIWQAEAGPLAYAYPTYGGSGPKTDLPAAERDVIAAVNAQAAREDQPAARSIVSRTGTLLLHACPIGGPVPDMTAWTMTRVQATGGLRPLHAGLAVLLALALLMSAWLGRLVRVWGRHVRGIEAALAGAGTDGMPAVGHTGERELDRIVDALNDAGRRLAGARRDADALAARVAQAERLAGLGRVAAGVAHEIRNPLAAARLQGENALAGDDARRRAAIGDMLGQLDRLDGLVGELLAMTQRAQPHPVLVDLAAFLRGQAAQHADAAAAKGVAVPVVGAEGTAVLDPHVVGRILDNLLTNAIRHAPVGGIVTLQAGRTPGRLALMVRDTGPGVPPDLADQVFEPFVTGRADGTGLGLAIARELADAHGGQLSLRGSGAGAAFVLDLPQQEEGT